MDSEASWSSAVEKHSDNLDTSNNNNRSTSTIYSEFSSYFSADDVAESGVKLLEQKASNGEFKNTASMRAIAWKIFLGVIPKNSKISEWEGIVTEKRKKYESLKKKHYVDPKKASNDSDLSIYNPLSDHVESPWNKFFQNDELQKEIKMDLTRIFPEYEFFHTDRISKMLLSVLFIYAKEYPNISYRQGMHELLAPMLLVLETGKIKANADESIEEGMDYSKEHVKLLKVLLSDNDTNLESDAYGMFESLMNTMGEWFVASKESTKKQRELASKAAKEAKAAAKVPISLDSKSNIFDNKKKDNATISSVQKHAPSAVQKCQRIQHVHLKERDPKLYEELQEHGIEPQLYALRWVRLLLGREFHLEDVLLLWDAIFADGLDLELVEYISLAMLLYIREQLIGRDMGSVMKRLFKYPPVENVHVFVEEALRLKDPKYNPDLENSTRFKSPGSNSMNLSNNTAAVLSGKTHGKGDGKPVSKVGAAAKKVIKSGKDHMHIPKSISGIKKAIHTKDPMDFSRPKGKSSPNAKKNLVSANPSYPKKKKGGGIFDDLSPIMNKKKTEKKKSHSSYFIGSADDPLDRLSRPSKPTSTGATISKAELVAEVEKGRVLGSRVEEAVNVLQSELLSTSNNGEYDRDKVFLSVAKLKQVKDILLGNVPFDSEKLTPKKKK